MIDGTVVGNRTEFPPGKIVLSNDDDVLDKESNESVTLLLSGKVVVSIDEGSSRSVTECFSVEVLLAVW